MAEPTARFLPFGDRVEIRLFGKPYDWSLANPISLQELGWQARAFGLCELLAPSPRTCNAKIADPFYLQDAVHAGEHVKLFRGVEADGVPLQEEQAAYFASADCLTIVAHDPCSGRTIAAHAGRDSLMDRRRISGKSPAREHESVVYAIADKFREYKCDLSDLKVFMTCGIGPHDFEHPHDHPEYGDRNMDMVFDVIHKYGIHCLQGDAKRGKLILKEIVRAQFVKRGVCASNIGSDAIDTYSDVYATGRPMWWSHRRDGATGRNGIMVKRMY